MPFRTDFTVLYQRGTGVVCFSFFFWLRVLDKAEYSAFESTLNSIVSYVEKIRQKEFMTNSFQTRMRTYNFF